MSTVPKLDERRRRVASERDVPAPEPVQDDLDDAGRVGRSTVS